MVNGKCYIFQPVAALPFRSGSYGHIGECKKICIPGRKCLLFGKNSDVTILVEKEHFYGNCKGADSRDYFTKQLKQCGRCLL